MEVIIICSISTIIGLLGALISISEDKEVRLLLTIVTIVITFLFGVFIGRYQV